MGKGEFHMRENRSKRLNFIKRLFRDRGNIHDLSPNTDDINEEHNILFNYFISLIDNYPGVIMLLSLDGKIISYSKEAINRYFGYDRKRPLSIEDIVSEESLTLMSSAFNKAKQGHTSQVEVKMFTKE